MHCLQAHAPIKESFKVEGDMYNVHNDEGDIDKVKGCWIWRWSIMP